MEDKNKLILTSIEFKKLSELSDFELEGVIKNEGQDSFEIEISDTQAESLSEKVQATLALEGFNLNYSENQQGMVLQSLIDKFYTIGW